MDSVDSTVYSGTVVVNRLSMDVVFVRDEVGN